MDLLHFSKQRCLSLYSGQPVVLESAKAHLYPHWILCPASLSEGLPHKDGKKLPRVVQLAPVGWPWSHETWAQCIGEMLETVENNLGFISNCFAGGIQSRGFCDFLWVGRELQKSRRAVLKHILVPVFAPQTRRARMNPLTCPSSSQPVLCLSLLLSLFSPPTSNSWTLAFGFHFYPISSPLEVPSFFFLKILLKCFIL